MDKHSQTLPDHWFERVPWHHQCCESYTTRYYHYKRKKIIWRWHQEDGYVKHCFMLGFHQSHPKAKLAPIRMATWQHGNIFEVTEITLDAASVAFQQPKNGVAPIMTWRLPGLTFSVETVLSVHCKMCNKTKTRIPAGKRGWLNARALKGALIWIILWTRNDSYNGIGMKETWMISAAQTHFV